MIIKLVIPFYILADVLLYYNLLSKISFIFVPITNLLNLPPECGIALAGGILLNLYTAIAFAAPLDLGGYQWTILALFLGICHSLPIESAIMRKLGVSFLYSVALRVSMAFLAVIPLLFLPESVFSPASDKQLDTPHLYDSFFSMISSSLISATILSLKIIVLISLLILIMSWIKSLPIVKTYTGRFNTLFSLIIGQILGITYGAAILLQESKQGNLNANDIFYIATFLMVCHSIIEDTLLFVIFGANLWLIITVRLTMAFIFTFILQKIFQYYKITNLVIKSKKLTR